MRSRKIDLMRPAARRTGKPEEGDCWLRDQTENREKLNGLVQRHWMHGLHPTEDNFRFQLIMMDCHHFKRTEGKLVQFFQLAPDERLQKKILLGALEEVSGGGKGGGFAKILLRENEDSA